MSGTAILPSSMFTTDGIAGLTAGETFVHRRAMLIITMISSLWKSKPNLGSTRPIKFPFPFNECLEIEQERKYSKRISCAALRFYLFQHMLNEAMEMSQPH